MRTAQSLSKLSDTELLSRVRGLAHEERKATGTVLRYLVEIERRELYLGCGYSSLYAFCRRHLRYSESAEGSEVPECHLINSILMCSASF